MRFIPLATQILSCSRLVAFNHHRESCLCSVDQRSGHHQMSNAVDPIRRRERGIQFRLEKFLIAGINLRFKIRVKRLADS